MVGGKTVGGSTVGDSTLGGAMVADGRALLRTASYLVVIPGVAIALSVIAVTLAGDGAARRLGIIER